MGRIKVQPFDPKAPHGAGDALEQGAADAAAPVCGRNIDIAQPRIEIGPDKQILHGDVIDSGEQAAVVSCSGTTAGYPTLRRGSRGCYVMILQDALSTLGYQTGSRIDGVFGARTEEALRGYQRRTSLSVDGVCGCNSWKKISTAVLGVGRTKTTID